MGVICLRLDECTIRKTGKLLRDLPEIKRIPVPGIEGQLFVTFDEKGGNGCRE